MHLDKNLHVIRYEALFQYEIQLTSSCEDVKYRIVLASQCTYVNPIKRLGCAGSWDLIERRFLISVLGPVREDPQGHETTGANYSLRIAL